MKKQKLTSYKVFSVVVVGILMGGVSINSSMALGLQGTHNVDLKKKSLNRYQYSVLIR